MPRHVTEADLLTFLDDTVTASNKTWSSTKIAAYVTTATSGLPVINDSVVSNTSVWSSQKTNNEINTRYAKVASPTLSNFVAFGSGGTLVDSGQSPSSFATAGHTHGILSGTITGFPSVSSQSGKVLSNNGSSLLWINAPSSLPAQGTHAGKFLRTNGSVASWQFIAAEYIPDFVSKCFYFQSHVVTTNMSGSVTLDTANGNIFYRNFNGNVALTFEDPEEVNNIEIIFQNTAATTIYVTWPSSVYASYSGIYCRPGYRVRITGVYINNALHFTQFFEMKVR